MMKADFVLTTLKELWLWTCSHADILETKITNMTHTELFLQ
jgi:hypothetical protein